MSCLKFFCFLLLSVILLGPGVHAQPNVTDSLTKLIAKGPDDSSKAKRMNALAGAYVASEP
jgi:hypothetical protein